jgi:competence protein ComEC
MHVAIIAMILNFMLSFLTKRKYGKALKGVLILLFLWSYALVAGLAPSVMRATLMFTIVTVGNMLERKINTYNNLAFAAFLICALDPYALYDAGFQLSFMAVLSIVFFYPHIYRLLIFKHKIANWAWEMIAVSVAANIGTFPIAIFLFHQFPVYFTVTGLLITLPTIGIMFLFLFALFCSWIPFVGGALCFLLNYCVKLINLLIRAIEHLPGSLIEGLWLTPFQVWSLILFIFFLSLFIWTKRRKLLLCCGVFMVLFCALRLSLMYRQQQQKLLVVYDVKNTTLLAFVNADKTFVICDSADIHNNFDFQLKNYMAYLGFKRLNDLQKIALQSLSAMEDQPHAVYHAYVDYFGRVIKILTDEKYMAYTQKVAVDFLIVTSKCLWKPQQVFDVYEPQQVILDASLSRAAQRNFEQYMNQRQLSFHNVTKQGAYLCNF